MIGFIADTHFTDKHIKWFGSGFFQRQLELFKEFLKEAQKRNCKYILFGGDMFDHPGSITSENLSKVLGLLKRYDNFTYISCIGNHDLRHSNYDDFKYSALYLLKSSLPEKIFYCNVFDESEIPVVLEENNYKFYIHNWNLHLSKIFIEEPLTFSPTRTNKDIQDVHVIHAPVGMKTAYGAINIDEIVKTTKDPIPPKVPIYLFGDQHFGWGVKFTSSGIYVNVGSFSKMNITEAVDDVKACFISEEVLDIVSFGNMGKVSTTYKRISKRKKTIVLKKIVTKSIKEISQDLGYSEKHILEIEKRSK